MPTIPALHGLARWQLKMSGETNPWFVTTGFYASNVLNAETFLGVMATSWEANLKASTTSDMTLVETSATYNDGTNIFDLENAVAVAGTGGTGVAPPNVALLVRKNTVYGGRKYRGRMFWPGILTGSEINPDGTIASATVTALQTHFNALYADCAAGAGSRMQLLHNDGTTAPTDLASFTVQPVCATQRRRLR